MLNFCFCILISAVTAKVIATHYFKKVDGYVQEICKMTEKNNEQTMTILRKLQKSFDQKRKDNPDTSED